LSLPPLLSKTQRSLGVLAAATLSLWAFLGRGGEIIGFYLVPLLPLLALNIALLLGLAIRRLHAALAGAPGLLLVRMTQLLVAGLCLTAMLAGYTPRSSDLGFKSDPFILWNDSQAVAQQQAVGWVEAHLPLGSRIIIDQYMWTDLHDNYPNRYAFAHYYWRVQDDPAIEHSTVIADFDTGGWPIDVRRVNNGEGQSLQGQSISVAKRDGTTSTSLRAHVAWRVYR
jgi:hypothetical protein